jgi:hypothetical protein
MNAACSEALRCRDLAWAYWSPRPRQANWHDQTPNFGRLELSCGVGR